MSSTAQFYSDASTTDSSPEDETASDLSEDSSEDDSLDDESSEEEAPTKHTKAKEYKGSAVKAPEAKEYKGSAVKAPEAKAYKGSAVKAPEAAHMEITPKMQMVIHKMLSCLQRWWEDSERLLKIMAEKKLPCDSMKKMSNEIDEMLDKAISLIAAGDTDPAVLPVAEIVHVAREIKRYVFLKVGELCCQSGNTDKCAKAANTALVTLKKFRNSANNLYDEMIAQVLQEMETPDVHHDNPELIKLIEQMK